MRRKKNSEWNLIEFPVIEAAVGGNTEALNGILKHYEAYISFLSIRWFYDENGIPRSYVDEEKRRMLEIKLVTMILNFEIVKVA
ncbi:helix-turn-helix domain-containing protein [Anaerotignum sp.]